MWPSLLQPNSDFPAHEASVSLTNIGAKVCSSLYLDMQVLIYFANDFDRMTHRKV